LIISSAGSKRGDIWLANFDPTVGAEIKKVRPAVIVSYDGVGKLPKIIK
jgi:mRNA interferase MazF